MKAAYGLFQRATSDLGMDAVGSGATALCFREARAASRGQPVFLRLDFASAESPGMGVGEGPRESIARVFDLRLGKQTQS